jgi:hypothetical protein
MSLCPSCHKEGFKGYCNSCGYTFVASQWPTSFHHCYRLYILDYFMRRWDTWSSGVLVDIQ